MALTFSAPPPYPTEAALLARAHALHGQTAQALISALLPLFPLIKKAPPKPHTGLLGQAVDLWLGSSPRTLDFPQLGIEVKTLALSERGKVKNPSFIGLISRSSLEKSAPFLPPGLRKLDRILWIPLLHLSQTYQGWRFLKPFYWSPNDRQRRQLQSAWETLNPLLWLPREALEEEGKGGWEASPLILRAPPRKRQTDGPSFEASSSENRSYACYLSASFIQGILREQWEEDPHGFDKSCRQ